MITAEQARALTEAANAPKYKQAVALIDDCIHVAACRGEFTEKVAVPVSVLEELKQYFTERGFVCTPSCEGNGTAFLRLHWRRSTRND